jgi:translation elongation factor EF-4
VDHGKSTLADRFLQMTNVIAKEEKKQFLDKLQVVEIGLSRTVTM